MLTLPVSTNDWKLPVTLQAGGTHASFSDTIGKIIAIKKQVHTLAIQLEMLNNGLPGIPFEQIDEASYDLLSLKKVQTEIFLFIKNLNIIYKYMYRLSASIEQADKNIVLIDSMLADIELLRLMTIPALERRNLDATTRKKLRALSHRRLALLASPSDMDEEVVAWQNANLNPYLN